MSRLMHRSIQRVSTQEPRFIWMDHKQSERQPISEMPRASFWARYIAVSAEAFGMLSLLRFLFHMAATRTHDERQLQGLYMVCNNQGLVQSVDKMLLYVTIFPNTTMEAKWDCVAEILQTIKALGRVTPTIEHIKGHQDEDTPYEQLSLSAQLNCDADSLANGYLQEYSTIDHSVSPVFLAGGCVLHLRKGTITRDIKHECAEARTLPPLQSKIIKDSDWWNPSVFNEVDWASHRRALKRLHHHRTTLVKYVHDLLPLGEQVNKYDTKYPPKCPSCKAPKENAIHFWRCPTATRITWR